MNAVARITPAAVAERKPPGPITPEGAAKVLRTIRAELRKPFDDLDAMNAGFRAWRDNLGSREADDWRRTPRIEPERIYLIGQLTARLSEVPDKPSLDTLATAFETALAHPFHNDRTRTLVSFMLASYPNARPTEPVIYQEAISHELEASGFPPAVIAKGCAEIVRTSTFAPSVAEVIAACTKAKEAATHAAWAMRRAIERRDEWLALLAAAEALTGLPEKDPPPVWLVKPDLREGEAA